MNKLLIILMISVVLTAGCSQHQATQTAPDAIVTPPPSTADIQAKVQAVQNNASLAPAAKQAIEFQINSQAAHARAITPPSTP